MKNNIRKVLFVGVIICVIVFLGLIIWQMLDSSTIELAANCDDGITVWRRNPGAFSGYKYEIRNGTTLVGTGLTRKQLNDALDGHVCVFLGGG